MTQDWSALFDDRPFREMRESLRHFSQGKIEIGVLVANLKELLSGLEEKDDDAWHTAFMARLGVLEQVFAAALDKSEPRLAKSPTGAIVPSSMILIESAIRDLGALVAVRLLGTEGDEY